MDGNNGPLIAAGGGLLLFISEFLDWFDVLGSAWEFMDIVDVVLAVLALIAIGIGAMLATGNTANLPSSPSGIVTTSGIIAFSIVVLSVVVAMIVLYLVQAARPPSTYRVLPVT